MLPNQTIRCWFVCLGIVVVTLASCCQLFFNLLPSPVCCRSSVARETAAAVQQQSSRWFQESLSRTDRVVHEINSATLCRFACNISTSCPLSSHVSFCSFCSCQTLNDRTF